MISLSIVQIMRNTRLFLLARLPKIAGLAYLIFSVFAFYIVKNLTYEQLFIWTIIHMFSYNIWRYVQKYILNLCNITNTETLHCCRSYPSYRPDPIPYNPTTIYYTPYNYISIMYISCCYHLSITYYIINYIIVSHTMQSNILLLCVVLLYLISTRI